MADISGPATARARARRPDSPIYKQIAEDLQRKIEAGDLTPGSQLPTEVELMETYSASRNTVRDAVRLLTARSLIETRAGQGTFVTEKIVPFVSTLTGDPATGQSEVYDAAVLATQRMPRSSAVRVEIQQAAGQIAAELKVPAGSPVVSRHQQRFIDDTPWSMQTAFYPMKLVEQGAARLLLAEDIPDGAVSYLADDVGIKQVGYRDQIKVRQPDQNEIAFFRLPSDGRVSVFSILRTSYNSGGEPVRVTVTVYPVDRNQFVLDVGEVPPAVSHPAPAGNGR